MGKKTKEFKAGDFIFAKVKGYPAWPARVRAVNGKKYFVHFYGTGETANLAANVLFDYVQNKESFLSKTFKRKDFNEGVKQIEYDFANNVPVEDVFGPLEPVLPADTSANDTANVSADTTMDTSFNETVANASTASEGNTTRMDDSEDGALVIDEGAKKGKKSTATPKPKSVKHKEAETSTPVEEKRDEVVSRSGRKIRPKRFVDEEIEENATMPTPIPKKRKAATPEPAEVLERVGKPSEPASEKDKNKQYQIVAQSEIESLKEPFPSDGQDNILVCKLPDNRWVGIRLFASRPASFKDAAARLAWETSQAKSSIQLKIELESGQTKPEAIASQLLLDLNLSDEEKANLNKEKEIEERKSRVQFLKAEMKLLDLDAKIKTCLNLTKADTEQCLKLLDELDALEVRPLMLLKHPAALETVKRMRSYVGNAPSWKLSEADALAFQARALAIRQRADALYTKYKALYEVPSGLKFWEFFSERVLQFKRITAELTANQLLEMVHEPPELSKPRAYTNQAAIDEANKQGDDKKKKSPGKKNKTPESTPTKTPHKGRPGRKPKEPETVPEKVPENDDSSKNEEPPKKVSKKADKSKKEEATKSSEDRTKPANENSTEQESSEIVSENNVPEEAPKETEATEKTNELPNDTENKSEETPKKVEASPRKINLKRKRESNQESPHKKKADAKDIDVSSQNKEETNKKDDSNRDKNLISEDKDSSSQDVDKSTTENNEINKDVDETKKDEEETIKAKDKTKKGKNETSKGKNEPGKEKNEINKGKEKANKTNDEASKDKVESSQDKEKTNNDDETNNDEDKTNDEDETAR